MASVSTRFLNLVITGENLSGPAISSLDGSLTNTARVSSQAFSSMGRSSGILAQQLYILRRSMEYAIAGFGIYKVYQAVAAWKSYRTELGTLNTTLQVSNTQLTQLGQTAIDVSNKTALPLQQVLQSMQNIAQTYPTLIKTAQGRANIAAFTTTEAQVANIIGAQPQDVGSTIGALATAFYGRNVIQGKKGPGVIQQIASQIVTLQKTAGLPNLSGEDLLSAMQNLVGGAKIGRFTLPQAESYFAVIEKQLASPSKASLYLRQLLARIVTPTTGEQAYFTQAGLPTGAALAGLSGNQIISQLVKAVVSQPGLKIGGRAVTGGNQFQQAVAAGFKDIQLGPQGIDLLEKAIGGRLQSGIAANLITNLYGTAITLQKQLQISPADASRELNARNQAYLGQIQFTVASNKLRNLSTQLVDNLNPLIQKTSTWIGNVAGFLTSANDWIAKTSTALLRKAGLSQASATLGGGILGALGIGVGGYAAFKGIKWTVSGVKALMRSILRRSGGTLGTREAEGAAEDLTGGILEKTYARPLNVSALQSALFGRANGSPEAPFWVVIHPLSLQTIPFLRGKDGSSGPTIPGTSGKQEEIQAALEAADVPPSVAKDVSEAANSALGGAGLATAVLKRKTILGRVASLGRKAITGAEDTINKTSIKLATGAEGDTGLTLAESIAGKALGPAAIIAGFLANSQNVNGVRIRGAKGTVPVQFGDYLKNVPETSALGALVKGRSIPSFAGGVLGQWRNAANSLFSEPKVQKDIENFVSGKISLTAVDRLLKTAAQGQQTQFFMSNAGVPAGVILPDSVEGTFKLEPTDTLKGLVKPQVIRGKVPMRYVAATAPAPTTKAKPTSRQT